MENSLLVTCLQAHLLQMQGGQPCTQLSDVKEIPETYA